MWSLVKHWGKNAIPVIFVVAGLAAIWVGYFIPAVDSHYNDLFKTVGSAILASGVFAFLLKFTQFAGVYREEISNLIFEARFLENRNDLPDYWQKVTKVLFKNRFPNISDKVIKDVQEIYLPTNQINYYDKAVHDMEIELEEDGYVKITQKVSFEMYLSDDKGVYRHSSSLVCSATPDKTSFELVSLKVDGQLKVVKLIQSRVNNELNSEFECKLNGKSKHTIEMSAIKRLNLKYDNIIWFSTEAMVADLRVQIFYSPSLKLNFLESGTLKDFKTQRSRSGYMEKFYTGVIYLRQGYKIVIDLI